MTNFQDNPQSCSSADKVPPPTISQKEHDGHFRPKGNVGDVNISMFVLNAMRNILQANVRSHQPTSAPMLENHDFQLLLKVLAHQS